jgi:flagellar biosynthesis anti-sigma factor FlgM
MKIATQTPQTAPTQQAEKNPQGQEAGAARKKASAKASVKGDTVQLSSSPDAPPEAEQAKQAERVQAIKEMVKAGTYKVDARAVAEKMVSGKPNK